MNSKKLIGIILLIAVAIGAGWYFLRNKLSGGAAGAALALKSYSPEDNACYNRLIAFFKANTANNGAALGWILPYVIDALAGKITIDPAYTVGGQLGKSGAFMALYASMYYKPDGSGMDIKQEIRQKSDGSTGAYTPQEFNDEMYKIFYEYKNLEPQKALAAL